MTGREWVPGDVAVVTITRRTGDLEPSTYLAFNVGDNYGWVGVSDGEPCGRLTDEEAYFIIERRPLVVLDPDDRDALLEFANAIPTCAVASHCDPQECMSGGCWTDRVQAALRSLITPPRPEEPKTLLASVEDDDGFIYVRQCTGSPQQDMSHPWLLIASNRFPLPVRDDREKRYADITAVRILSEGVS